MLPTRSRGSVRGSVVPLVLAAGGVAAMVGVWVVLASMSGLIYHLLPGATFLAASWVFRQVEHGRQAAWPEIAVIVATGALGTTTGVLLVGAIGRELDAAPITWLVAIGGALVGAGWLRHVPTSEEAGSKMETEQP